jgi:hypothetical protein
MRKDVYAYVSFVAQTVSLDGGVGARTEDLVWYRSEDPAWSRTEDPVLSIMLRDKHGRYRH